MFDYWKGETASQVVVCSSICGRRNVWVCYFLVLLAAVAIQCLDLFIRAVIKAEVYMYGQG